MSDHGAEKRGLNPAANPERTGREEFGEELRNPGMNAEGRTGAGAGAIPPSEAEADAATSRAGEQAGTPRDAIHQTEDDDSHVSGGR
ncbi:hypothetical protein [Sphingobium sp.]|uniref:hypothetical protein n=1 Tax=Sphingobium sp. TaxID=1912891 RepID=UPI002B6CEB53|nr:hypothetical protein [Sphingobium sp.]HUD95812.1 hypothetical protein [Sphingobium sp.]